MVKGSGDGGGSGGRSVWMWCSLEKRLLAVMASIEARRGEARGLRARGCGVGGLGGKRAWVKEDKMLLLTGTLLRCCSLLCCVCCCYRFCQPAWLLRGGIELSSPPRRPVAAGFSLFPSEISLFLSHTYTRTQTHTRTHSLTSRSRPPKPTFAPTAFLQSDRDK